MTRLYFNVDIFSSTPTGIHRYATEILHHLVKHFNVIPISFTQHSRRKALDHHLQETFGIGPIPTPRFRLRCSRRLLIPLHLLHQPFDSACLRHQHKRSWRFKFLKELYRPLSKIGQLLMRFAVFDHSDDKPAILFTPFHAVPPHFHSPQLLTIQMLHDIIPMRMSRFYTAEQIDFFSSIIHSAERADAILTNSAFTRQDFLDFLPHADPQRVFVTGLASARNIAPVSCADSIQRIKMKYGIGDNPYILMLSSIHPRKNHLGLLEAWKKVLPQLKGRNIKLLIVGGNVENTNDSTTIVHQAQAADSVILTGYADEADLSALYSACLFSVYPSFCEGFGLPVLESMTCGRFCLASNTSSLPEVVGPNLPMCDPANPDDMAAKMLELLLNPAYLDACNQQALKNARRFSWAETSRKTIDAIQSIIS